MLRKIARLWGARSQLNTLWSNRKASTRIDKQQPTKPITEVIDQLVSESFLVDRPFELNGVSELTRLVHEEVDYLVTSEISTTIKGNDFITTFAFNHPYPIGKWHRYEVSDECTQLLTPLASGCVVVEINWKKKIVTYYLPSELVEDYQLAAMYEIPLSSDKHVYRLPSVIRKAMMRAKEDALIAQVDYVSNNLAHYVQDELRSEVNTIIKENPLGFEVRYAKNEKSLILILIDQHYVNAEHRVHEWLFSHMQK